MLIDPNTGQQYFVPTAQTQMAYYPVFYANTPAPPPQPIFYQHMQAPTGNFLLNSLENFSHNFKTLLNEVFLFY